MNNKIQSSAASVLFPEFFPSSEALQESEEVHEEPANFSKVASSSMSSGSA